MAQSDLEVLLEMGFERERAELAIKKTGGLQGALTWLEETQDKPLEELKAAGAATTGKYDDGSDDEGATQAAITALVMNQEAKSLVCNECGKLFRSQATAEFHAAKSGHVDFAESAEEIAPLTEEQKVARLAELREKLQLKRANQANLAREEAKRNEQIRLKSTKESQDMKEELQRKEQIKEAARKRAEKREDLEAKKRIKARIEADKEERRRKAEEIKAAREGRAPVQPTAASTSPAAAGAASVTKSASAHNQARLRLQTPSGSFQKTFEADATLLEVAQALEADNAFKAARFEQTFPRKVFEAADLSQTLRELGLVPSAVLRVS